MPTTHDFTIGLNNTLPHLVCTLQPAAGQTFVLTGSTVRFKAWRHSTRELVIDAPADVLDDVLLKVSYSFTLTETVSRDVLDGVFEVTFPGGDVQSFPNKVSDRISIAIG